MKYKKNWLTSHMIFSLNVRTAMPDVIKSVFIKMGLMAEGFGNLSEVLDRTSEHFIKNTEALWNLQEKRRESSDI